MKPRLSGGEFFAKKQVPSKDTQHNYHNTPGNRSQRENAPVSEIRGTAQRNSPAVGVGIGIFVQFPILKNAEKSVIL